MQDMRLRVNRSLSFISDIDWLRQANAIIWLCRYDHRPRAVEILSGGIFGDKIYTDLVRVSRVKRRVCLAWMLAHGSHDGFVIACRWIRSEREKEREKETYTEGCKMLHHRHRSRRMVRMIDEEAKSISHQISRHYNSEPSVVVLWKIHSFGRSIGRKTMKRHPDKNVRTINSSEEKCDTDFTLFSFRIYLCTCFF